MLRRVRLHAISSRFRTEIFEKNSRPQNFAFEVACDRSEIHAAWWCAACSGPAEVPEHCGERRHAAPCAIARDFERIWTENFEIFFRGRKLLRSQSPRDRAKIRAVAALRPDEVLSNCAESRHAAECAIACDSPRISDRNFRKIFAAAKFCVQNHARSRRNPCRRVVHSLPKTLRGPQHLCRASACCSA